MVLRGADGQHGFAVGQNEKRGFLTGHEVFDDDLGTGVAENAAEHFVNCGFRVFNRFGDDDTLAGCKAVGLDHDRRTPFAHIAFGRVGIAEPGPDRGWRAARVADFLGEGLGGFQFGGGHGRSEHREAGGPQIVCNPGRQRRFRADDYKPDCVFLSKSGNGTAVEDVQLGAFGDFRDPGVARRHDQPIAFRVLLCGPGEAVFPPAAAKDQDIHRLPFTRCACVLSLPEEQHKATAMDLIDDPQPGENTHEFTVSEISGAVKRMIEGEFAHVRVKGEVGRVSRPRSGHVYLDLKDDRSVLSGVIWKGVAARLATQPEEGIEVVATGRLTTFPGQSKYQIVIDDIRPAGVGALMAMLEKRKAQLQAEGLFDTARKKPIPYLPEVIGIVTSPSGAVIRDILHRLQDRFPRKVLVWPVAVQGEKCAPEVTRAIEGFNAMTPGGALPRPDLLIVARGGGSIEDLWGFNEEIVARAAAASEIPLISAVGHETDTTLIDYVSDLRAPTPTAAAELAVPVRRELLAWVDEQGARLSRAVSQGLDRRGQRVADLGRGLPRPDTLLATPRQRLDTAAQALPMHLQAVAQAKRATLTELSGAIRPAAVMRRLSAESEKLRTLSDRQAPSLTRMIARKGEALRLRTDRLSLERLGRDLELESKRLSDLAQRLSIVAEAGLAKWQDLLAALDRTRLSLGYEATLARGYAVVWDGARLVPGKSDLGAASALEIQFRDGRVPVSTGARPVTKPKKHPPEPDQGSLF